MAVPSFYTAGQLIRQQYFKWKLKVSNIELVFCPLVAIAKHPLIYLHMIQNESIYLLTLFLTSQFKEFVKNKVRR